MTSKFKKNIIVVIESLFFRDDTHEHERRMCEGFGEGKFGIIHGSQVWDPLLTETEILAGKGRRSEYE